LKRIFDYFDDGCDGSISIDDFPSALRACGMNAIINTI
jgi:Ca2+-binding EF-hand superfamily protein